MPTVTKTQYVCLCVAEQKDSGYSHYKRGAVTLSDHDLGDLYSVEKYQSRNDVPAMITLSKQEIVVNYVMPSPEELAEITLPIMEAGLQKLRADFMVAETRFLADIASIRQLTYKGPIEGDYVAAADSAREVNPRKDEEVEDAEILPPNNNDKPLDIPF